MVLNFDLNFPPHDEDSLGINNSLNVDTTLKLGLPCVQVRTSYEADDDDVILCSPRSFAEVKISTIFLTILILLQSCKSFIDLQFYCRLLISPEGTVL